MNCISTGKNARHRRLHVLVYNRPAGSRINCNFTAGSNFVLWNETNRKKQSITFNKLFCSGNRLTVRVYCRNSNSLNPLLAVNLHNRVAELQWNIKVFNTLNNISSQPRTERHNLAYKLYLGTFQCEASCHNQPDITRAKNYNLTSGHITVYIYKALSRTRSKNTGRAGSRNNQGTTGSLTTAGCEHNSLCFNVHKAVRRVDCSNRMPLPRRTFLFHLQHHSISFIFNSKLIYLFRKAGRILRTGQFLTKIMKSESIMNTLQQNSADSCIAL